MGNKPNPAQTGVHQPIKAEIATMFRNQAQNESIHLRATTPQPNELNHFNFTPKPVETQSMDSLTPLLIVGGLITVVCMFKKA